MSILIAYLILAFVIGMIVGILSTDKFLYYLQKIHYRNQDKKRSKH